MPTVLVTGFPGFLGSELVRRILRAAGATRRRLPGAGEVRRAARTPAPGEIVATEERRRRTHRARRPATSPGPDSDSTTRATLTRRGARDLPPRRGLRPLGAARGRDEGQRRGDAPRPRPRRRGAALRALQYVSTCYVSGAMDRHLPRSRSRARARSSTTSTRRPSTWPSSRCGGGSPAGCRRRSTARRSWSATRRTGETQKYDGPYYVLRWLLKQPTVAVLPVPGDPERTRDQRRAARFRGRRDRGALDLRRRRRRLPTSSPIPSRRRSTR